MLATTGNTSAVAALNACINTRKFKGLDSREITSLLSLWSDRIRGPTRFGKVLNLIFPSFLRKTCVTSIKDFYSQSPRSSLGTPGTMTPFCVISTKKNALQIMSLAAYVSVTNYDKVPTNCGRYYKLRQLFQITTIIIHCSHHLSSHWLKEYS